MTPRFTVRMETVPSLVRKPGAQETVTRIAFPLCTACAEMASVDDATGYCRPCWRLWRFTVWQDYAIASEEGGAAAVAE